MSDTMQAKMKEGIIRRQRLAMEELTAKNISLQEENIELKKTVLRLVTTIEELANLTEDAYSCSSHILEKL